MVTYTLSKMNAFYVNLYLHSRSSTLEETSALLNPEDRASILKRLICFCLNRLVWTLDHFKTAMAISSYNI